MLFVFYIYGYLKKPMHVNQGGNNKCDRHKSTSGCGAPCAPTIKHEECRASFTVGPMGS
jgi:hypothetical protein